MPDLRFRGAALALTVVLWSAPAEGSSAPPRYDRHHLNASAQALQGGVPHAVPSPQGRRSTAFGSLSSAARTLSFSSFESGGRSGGRNLKPRCAT